MPNSLATQHYPDDFFILSYHGTLASDTILFWADRDYVIDQISLTLLNSTTATTSITGLLTFYVTSDASDFIPSNIICQADCKIVANGGTASGSTAGQASGTTFVFDSERFPVTVTKQFNTAGAALAAPVTTPLATGATTAIPFSSTNNTLRRGQFLTMGQAGNAGASGLIQIRLRSRIG